MQRSVRVISLFFQLHKVPRSKHFMEPKFIFPLPHFYHRYYYCIFFAVTL